MVEVMKRSHPCTAALSAPSPAAGHHRPMSLPETPEHPWASLGQSLVRSLLLSAGSWCTEAFVCALPESVSPVLCKLRRLCGGVNGASSMRAYATPRSAPPRAPAPAVVHC